MFVTIPNRRGGVARVARSISIGVSRSKDHYIRLEIYIDPSNSDLVETLGLNGDHSMVDIAVGVPGTPDEGLACIKRGSSFAVQQPNSWKKYYRTGFYLPKSMSAMPAIRQLTRTWLPERSIKINRDAGEVLFTLPDPIRTILPKIMLQVVGLPTSDKETK